MGEEKSISDPFRLWRDSTELGATRLDSSRHVALLHANVISDNKPRSHTPAILVGIVNISASS